MDRREICRQVARLHVACISQGFLPQLGEKFLALMYEAIDESEDAALITAVEGDRVIGFVSGAMGMRPVYRRMLRRLPHLAWTLLPSLFRPARVTRILEILRYGQDQNGHVDLPRAELLSIAVIAEARGTPCAERLYRDLSDFFAMRGERAFRIIVGGALVPAQRFYAKMGAVRIGEVQVHRGEASCLYLQRIPR